MKEYMLSLKEKISQHWFTYFQNARKYYICVKFFYNWPVKYYDFGYRCNISCLYLPQWL